MIHRLPEEPGHRVRRLRRAHAEPHLRISPRRSSVGFSPQCSSASWMRKKRARRPGRTLGVLPSGGGRAGGDALGAMDPTTMCLPDRFRRWWETPWRGRSVRCDHGAVAVVDGRPERLGERAVTSTRLGIVVPRRVRPAGPPGRRAVRDVDAVERRGLRPVAVSADAHRHGAVAEATHEGSRPGERSLDRAGGGPSGRAQRCFISGKAMAVAMGVLQGDDRVDAVGVGRDVRRGDVLEEPQCQRSLSPVSPCRARGPACRPGESLTPEGEETVERPVERPEVGLGLNRLGQLVEQTLAEIGEPH